MSDKNKEEEGTHVCPLHDKAFTALKTDVTWLIHNQDAQTKHLWGITIGIILIMLKVVLFA